MLEPITATTDFLLSFENLLFSLIVLLKVKKPNRFMWFFFFLFIGLGAFQGALFHGFSWAHNPEMWRFVTLFLVLGITFFPFAVSTLNWHISVRFIWSFVAVLSLGVSFLLLESHNFLHIVIYELIMLLICAIMSLSLIKKGIATGKYLLIGIALSFIAAGIQQSDLKILIFNNNDLFHLIQIIGQALFFMGWKRNYEGVLK